MEHAIKGSVLSNSLKEGNLMVYSRLHEAFYEWKSGHSEVVIKYVMSGEERYTLNRKSHIVQEGSFLLVNKGQNHDIAMPYNSTPVTGLCMSLSSELLNEVLLNNTAGERWLLDNPDQKSNVNFDFFEGIYKRDDGLSQYISSLEKELNRETGKLAHGSEELFYSLAQHLLASQCLVQKQAASVSANRYSTQKELYKRVNKARQLMDDHLGQNLEMSQLAGAVAMSEFHFFRTYKQVYGISPHQYQLKKKMENAKKMLLENKLSITNIALICGFADLQSFSKSFKKSFGISPASFRK